MQVWLAMTREEGAANPHPKVFSSEEWAHVEIHQFAEQHNVHPDMFDLEHDEAGRILWFEALSGNGPEAWIDGPLEVHEE